MTQTFSNVFYFFGVDSLVPITSITLTVPQGQEKVPGIYALAAGVEGGCSR
jgi:hypothetical protein